MTEMNAWVLLTARVCHEANRAIQLNIDADQAAPKWDIASHEQKKSMVEGVIHALKGATPEELHEHWCRNKIADGWMYGPVRDNTLKHHPCLVPYMELPQEQILKDFVFSEIVQAFKDTALLGPDNVANMSV